MAATRDRKAEFGPVAPHRKTYATPHLVHHGDMARLTQEYGAGFVDTPFGSQDDLYGESP